MFQYSARDRQEEGGVMPTEIVSFSCYGGTTLIKEVVMAGKKGMPRATPKELAARLERAVGHRRQGMTCGQIGALEGVTARAIQEMLRRAKRNKVFSRVCALVECDVEFDTQHAHRSYCCRKHSKRGSRRQGTGLVAEYRKCRLPGCDEDVLAVGSASGDVGVTTRHFCCRTHGDRHYNRIENGYYEKLVNRTACRVCGWWGPGIERHHIKPKHEGGSDHPNNLAWLCQNCHVLLHSGLATFNHRREFVDLREEVRASEIERRKMWGE